MRFLRAMRLLLLLCVLAATGFAAVPRELATALETFRSDPPRGWSFTQTTAAEGKSTVEHHDAAKPEFDRWSLLQKDGRAPTAGELKDYAEARSRRSRTGTAPKIVDQFILEAIETVSDSSEKVVYRCPLRPGEVRDDTARFLRATIVVHKPTHTIESIELASISPFTPTFAVRIEELKTLMTYRRPDGDTPEPAAESRDPRPRPRFSVQESRCRDDGGVFRLCAGGKTLSQDGLSQLKIHRGELGDPPTGRFDSHHPALN